MLNRISVLLLRWGNHQRETDVKAEAAQNLVFRASAELYKLVGTINIKVKEVTEIPE